MTLSCMINSLFSLDNKICVYVCFGGVPSDDWMNYEFATWGVATRVIETEQKTFIVPEGQICWTVKRQGKLW